MRYACTIHSRINSRQQLAQSLVLLEVELAVGVRPEGRDADLVDAAVDAERQRHRLHEVEDLVPVAASDGAGRVEHESEISAPWCGAAWGEETCVCLRV